MMRILLFLCFSIILKSQNIDPTPLDFDPDLGSTKYLSEYINAPDEYIRGFQWSVGIKLSDPRALNMNAGGALESHFLEVQPNIYINKLFDGHSYTTDYQIPSRKMWAYSTLEHMPVFAQGILLEPSLQIDPNDYEYEVVDDYLNPIFGFENVNGSVVQRGQSSKLLIETSLFLGEKVEILSKPYTTSMLKKLFETSQDQIEAEARGEVLNVSSNRKIKKIEIYNQLGKKVFFKQNLSTTRYSIDSGNLSTGMYYLIFDEEFVLSFLRV